MALLEQHSDSGSKLMERGLLIAARDEFLACLAQAEKSLCPGKIMPPLIALSRVAFLRRDLDAALGFLERALTLAEEPSVDRVDRLRVYLPLMMIYTERGRLDEALVYAHKAATLQADQEPVMDRTYWVNLSMLHWRRQEWGMMLEASDQAYERSRTAGDLRCSLRSRTNRGIAYLELGSLDLASRDLAATLEAARQLGQAELAYVQVELGRLQYRRGDYQGALQAGREALSALVSSVSILDKEEVARVSRLFGAIFATLGHRNLSLKYLNRAAAYYSQLGLRGEWERATAAIGDLLVQPVHPVKSNLQQELHHLDFLTNLLDLIDDLESVDPYLHGHSERVAALAVMLGGQLGLSGEMLVTLNHAARLHDVGMVAVETELIHREGPLTPAERRRVAMHTEIGVEMISPTGLNSLGLEAVLHHHEHYDGSGSPNGLKGDEIPLLARLITLADVYDALTSERSYRKAMNHTRAVEEMMPMAGRDLDPELVHQFLLLHEV